MTRLPTWLVSGSCGCIDSILSNLQSQTLLPQLRRGQHFFRLYKTFQKVGDTRVDSRVGDLQEGWAVAAGIEPVLNERTHGRQGRRVVCRSIVGASNESNVRKDATDIVVRVGLAVAAMHVHSWSERIGLDLRNAVASVLTETVDEVI